jgi:shikimate dehydrogenase
MRKYGLIGNPLGHSFSKKYFTDKFLSEGITDCIYENYPMKNLEGFQRFLAEDDTLCGLNVTIPYKSEVLKFLDYLDPEAAEIGAVNVLKISRSGGSMKLSGYNSDVSGITDTIFPYINNISAAIILGTGGASKAVCHVLEKLAVKVIRVSREAKPGVKIYSDLNSEILDNSQLIINTTPLGMFPDVGSMPDLNYSLLNRNHILFDLVYNPEITSFLRMGIEHGCTVLSGIRMLHSQAEKSWEIWNSNNF